jgi:hypothetical protein
MPDRSIAPRWLMGLGVILLAAGYAALETGSSTSRLFIGPGRLAFFAGLASLFVGVIVWLRQPPGPDPADVADDRTSRDET